jgi:hypothetical protein
VTHTRISDWRYLVTCCITSSSQKNSMNSNESC